MYTLYSDGGTSCNSPRNYGIAYGSYAIFEKETEIYREMRIKFGNGSNNFAEVMACYNGLLMARLKYNIKEIKIVSDSKILINRVKLMKFNTKSFKGKAPSQEFSSSLLKLKDAIQLFDTIHPRWTPRENIFRIFQH